MYKKLAIFSCLFLLVDQISKILVSFNMTLNQSITVIPNFFNIEYVKNIGAAFSILEGHQWLFIILGFIFLNIIFSFCIYNKDLKLIEIISYSLLLSGIVGNMIDRIIYGYVIDFLSFTIFGYPFAIFNLADSFIVIGVLLIIIWGQNEKVNSRK